MEFSKLAGGPPHPTHFGKVLRMNLCFDLCHLKIYGKSCNILVVFVW